MATVIPLDRYRQRRSIRRPELLKLSARPRYHVPQPPVPGLQPLGMRASRDGLLYVPPACTGDRPNPLILLLHAAGGSAQFALAPFLSLADRAGTLLLAPESQGRVWDFSTSSADIESIDQALEQTFERYLIDPARLAIGGFSGGASQALALGLANGELFRAVLAFSPAFILPERASDPLRVFLAHGVSDDVVPIEASTRKIAASLQPLGLNPKVLEFSGGHTLPLEIAREALDWFLMGA